MVNLFDRGGTSPMARRRQFSPAVAVRLATQMAGYG